MPVPAQNSDLGVAFITVSYGSGEALRNFLASLRQFHGDSVPVVVVDNKPDDENVLAIAQSFGAAYLAQPLNPGYGAAMNAGVRYLEASDTSASFYFFCNPDVIFLEEAAAALVHFIRSDARIGAIAPRVLNEDGTTFASARNIPSIGTGVGHALLSKIWPTNPWTRIYTSASNYEKARDAGWLSGAAVMVRDDVFRSLNGWDESYFMYFEDVDLGWRIANSGLRNRYEPSIALTHTGAHSTRKHKTSIERAMTESSIRFMRKRYPGPLRAPLRWTIVLGLKIRGWHRMRLTA
ncbi:MAG: glycosyltransferase family 2 protein [Aeromicrobium sp.]|nr:MAG: glycosyltransferase family 2 protein [Aeromicrobium sp.]